MYIHVLIYTQMDQNLDDAVMSLTDNHPCIDMVIGGSSVQLFLVVERCVLEAIERAQFLKRVLQPIMLLIWPIQSQF